MSLIVTDKRFHSGVHNHDYDDVKVYWGKDDRTGRPGFVSEYPNHPFIEKTETLYLLENYADNTVTPGQITVYLRNGNGEIYTFDCWATGWCNQFGINVSADGTKVYVISDEKGLWCYTIQGKLLWKTRFTSASHIFNNPDGSITCMTSANLLVLDSETGKVLKKRSVMPYESDKLSPTLIAAAISENTVAIIDSATLEVLQKISLSKLGLDDYHAIAVSDSKIAISGDRYKGVEVFRNNKRRMIEEHYLFLLNRGTSEVIKRYSLEEFKIHYCPFLEFRGNELILNGFIGESGRGREVRIPIDD